MAKKLLIIDDSKTQLSSLKLVLTKAGYDVTTAENAFEGIEAAHNCMPDLIISDIVMPEVNGYHLCRLLKDDEHTKHIPIILLTVLSKKLDKFWGLRAGADAFFQKDGNYDKLLEEIEKLLNYYESNKNELSVKSVIHEEEFDYKTKVAEILDQALIDSTIMNEFRDLSEFVLDIKTLNFRLFSLISSILDYNVCGLFFNDKDMKKDKVMYFSKNEYDVSNEILTKISTEFFNMIFPGQMINAEYNVSESFMEYTDSIKDYSDFQSISIIPIDYEGKLIGGLALYHKLPNKYLPSKIFNIILTELKLIMRIKWLYSETKFLAITDSLTGLYNRRYFQQILEREFSRSTRYGSRLSIAMMDIDNFKKLNDTYGHLFGDEVLMVLSKLLTESLRKTDYVARYGGEEFVTVLPETNIEQAIIPLERFRNKLENHAFMFEEKRINVTISIGIAQNDDRTPTSDSFIMKADNALYQAKQKGKNRIELGVVTV
ncbi:MAG: diguanylate cyclase [Candidatus Gastranaerophilaceae bacterium]|jgi:two-component system cell cycle response regulator